VHYLFFITGLLSVSMTVQLHVYHITQIEERREWGERKSVGGGGGGQYKLIL
jgi:hypothetical protein